MRTLERDCQAYVRAIRDPDSRGIDNMLRDLHDRYGCETVRAWLDDYWREQHARMQEKYGNEYD